MTYIKVMHMMITHLQIHVPLGVFEKPLPSIFVRKHSLHVFLPMFIQQGLVGYQGGLWQ